MDDADRFRWLAANLVFAHKGYDSSVPPDDPQHRWVQISTERGTFDGHTLTEAVDAARAAEG